MELQWPLILFTTLLAWAAGTAEMMSAGIWARAPFPRSAQTH
ncbi:MAG: hypothetical protein UFX72_03105 [Adlercreutzia sp.]|nr:hypothetical protein [Adlercreutzia sp.]